MRSYRGRKKKLVVAFHFQFARQAAWECDTCRKQGLESKRRCPWIPERERGPERLVWIRSDIRVTSCPRGLISAASLEFIERWQVARVFGFGDVAEMPARVVDAFCVLENELARENKHDEE